MERENFAHSELTGQSINPTLESGGNIMTDAPGGAEAPPRPGPITPEQVQQRMRDWVSYLQRTSQEIDADTLSSARLAAESGIAAPALSAEGQTGEQGAARPQRRSRREAIPLTPEQEAEELRRVTSSRYREAGIQKKWEQSLLTDRAFRNEYFNQLFALVDAQANVFFDRAFNPLTYGSYYEEFMEVMLEGSVGRRVPDPESVPEGVNYETYKAKIKSELEEDFRLFQRQKQLRQTLHDVNAVLYLPSVKAEDLFNNMQQFQSSDGDLAFRMPGVREMMNLYEEALYENMAQNEGYLDPEAVLGRISTRTEATGSGGENIIESVAPGEIEKRTKDRFKELLAKGLIVARTDKGPEPDKGGEVTLPEMKSWEIDRTFTYARGMMIMTQRLIEIAADSRLPKGGTKFASVFLQDILQTYTPGVHMWAKWNLGEEALTALLFDSQKKGMFEGWSPKELYKIYKEYEKNPAEFLERFDQTFYLGKKNANRAGGFWTFNTWRAIESETERSALRAFLKAGKAKMQDRMNAWKAAHPGENLPQDYLDEYKKWTGTGFRLEKLRSDIEKAMDEESDMAPAKRAEVKEKARQLVGKMVEFQTHRLYLTSNFIRQRVLKRMGIANEADMTDPQKADFQQRLDDLHSVEMAFLKNRERFLNEGRTFDSITSADLEQYFGQVIADPQRIAKAKELMWQVQQDFINNKDMYWKEFIEKREYHHGFVLWTGDIPVDEYRMAELGPTGALVRRARDNGHQAKAVTAEGALLENLKNITHPDQLVSGLFQIWTNIDHYDRSKARQAIADKAEGYIKFFKETWTANIPIWGITRARGLNASYARMVYGSNAPAWAPSDIYYFIQRLEDGRMINEEQANRLRKLTGSTKKKVLVESGVALSQIFAFLFLVLTGESIAKTKWEEI